MSYEFGDVVLVPFPFTNQTASKRRPAVIVSSQPLTHNRTFFSEEKNQKTFIPAPAARSRPWPRT
jgi:hypothetical protein